MAAAKKSQKQAPEPTWTFLTNHGHVLVCIAQNPDIRITETAGGYVKVKKDGRRNTYSVDFTRHLRHPLESDHTIGEIFRSLARLRRG